MRMSGASVHLSLNRGFRWHHLLRDGGEVWAKGYAFREDQFHDSERLAGLFGQLMQGRPTQEAVDIVRQLNGSFAVAVRTRDAMFAAVDRLRSIPLFYGTRDGKFLLSDDAFWVRGQAGDTSIDSVSEGEFLRTSYVFGRNTLSPSVRQLQPGEYLLARPDGTEAELYYRHVHGPYFDLTETAYFDQLDAISRSVFRRLVDSVQGRTILLPLSGGYDSRYIAAMLKTLAYERVICYTYGRASSFEVATSRQVAQKLGFPWHYVEYNRERWQDYFFSEGAAEYNVFASNLASLPCLQESIAVSALKRNSAVPEDAIVVPGYAGATGFPVPPGRLQGDGRLTKELVEYTFDENFCLPNQVSASIADKIRDHRAQTFLDLPSGDGIDDVISANEAWFTAHRLSRFIVNAVRVYEFNGYEWRMPLWDNEMAEYWYRVPENLRANRRLYEAYLLRRVFPQHGIDWKRHTKHGGRLVGFAKRVLTFLLPARALRSVRRSYYRTPQVLQAGDINGFSEISRLYRNDLGPGHAVPEATDVCVAHAVWYIRALKDARTSGEVAPRRLGVRRPGPASKRESTGNAGLAPHGCK
jgi:asparagine synthase (glutamine-hydrolysing)